MSPFEMKTCTACGKSRELIAFYKSKKYSSGYDARCKPCFNKVAEQMAGTLIRTDKSCSSCRQIKPVKLFNKSSLSRDGYGSYCKQCASAKHKEYIANNPKMRMRSIASARAYRQNQDSEERKKLRREYYHKNRERILQQRKEKRANAAMR